MPYNDFRSDIPSHESVIGCDYEGADYSPEAQFDNFKSRIETTITGQTICFMGEPIFGDQIRI